MASFSFGAGNAGKLLRVPLYIAGRVVTAVVPRSRGEWVVGCAVGVADGALALWRRAADDDVHAVWLTSNREERALARQLGIAAVPKNSLRGFWRTARARVIVVTHGFGDVNRYAATGGLVVQLWHGIPLKRIGLDAPGIADSPLPFARALLTAAYRGTQGRIGVLPAASHLVRGRLESAFGLPGSRIVVTGEPRVDVLSEGTPGERRATARERLSPLLSPLGERRVVLYAPTWRDGAPDPATPTPAQWERLLDVLDRHDAVLAIRSHPLGGGDYTPPLPTDRVRDLGSDLVADVTPLLPALDALVTDYSSLAFDAGLVPLPTVFLAPDLADYSRGRGFYGTYRDVAGDDPAATWDEAAEQLDALWSDPSEHERRREAAAVLSGHVHAFRDGRNTERVYRAIRERLRGRA